MVTSIYAAYYGAVDLVVGNLVGSETAQNTLAIAVVAFIKPIVDTRQNIAIYGPSMTLLVLTLEGGGILRSEGLLILLAYTQVIYIFYTNEGGEEITKGVIEEPRTPRQSLPWIVGGLTIVLVGGQLMVTYGVTITEELGIPVYIVGILTGMGRPSPK